MKTWILVADAGRARLFEAGDSDGVLNELADLEDSAAREPGSASTRGPKPRVHESHGSARHAIEPRHTPEEKAEHAFAMALAEILEHGRVDHDYQRLILVAPPHFLGQLRLALGDQVRKLVAGSVDKDLVRASPEEIREMLQRA